MTEEVESVLDRRTGEALFPTCCDRYCGFQGRVPIATCECALSARDAASASASTDGYPSFARGGVPARLIASTPLGAPLVFSPAFSRAARVAAASALFPGVVGGGGE